MTEVDLRKWHRTAGIALAVFVVIQATTGLYFTFEDLNFLGTNSGGDESPVEDFLGMIHHGLGFAGAVYRTATGLGLLFLALTGFLIWRRIKGRASIHQRVLRPVTRPDRQAGPMSS